jgi:hypothetical protein
MGLNTKNNHVANASSKLLLACLHANSLQQFFYCCERMCYGDHVILLLWKRVYRAIA